jgi:cell wall-associated NlpC family hydrolase
MKVRKLAALAALTVSAALVGTQFAAAAPLDDKRAQASRLQAQLEANGQKISALGEKANGARYRLAETTKALADAEAGLADAEANARALLGALGGRAAELLKQSAAGNANVEEDLDLSELESAAQRAKYAELTNDRDREALNKLAYIQEDLAAKRSTLSEIKAQRQAESDAISRAEAELRKANAEQQRALNSVNAEIRQLAEQQRQEESRASAARAGGGRSRDFGTGPSITDIAAPNSTARAAIAFAQAQLGKPYVYAASGPNSYDCSGLTMSAYAAAGVGMPHYSGAQFRSFPQVSMDALSPGDLIFWGPGGSNHVAIYVGGGTIIHAPRTGDVVRYAPIYGRPSGAVRPWA